MVSPISVKSRKLAIFLFLYVAGAFVLEFFTYKCWNVFFYIDIHVWIKNDIEIKLLLIYIDIHVCLKYITTPNQGCMRHTSWRCMQIVGKCRWGNVVTVYLRKCRNTIFYLHTVKVINFGIPCRCAFVVILVTVCWWCTSQVYITGVHHKGIPFFSSGRNVQKT